MDYLFLTPRIEIVKYSFLDGEKYHLHIHGQNWKRKPNKQNPYEFEINKVAKDILILFDGTKTFEDIVKVLSDNYQEDMQKVTNIVNQLLNTLISRYGFKINKQAEPVEKNKVLLRGFETRYPTVVSVELTSRCNVKCKHCYGHFGSCAAKDIPKENLKPMFDKLAEIGVLTVELTGGDPSMYPYISEAIELAFESGIQSVMLLTNGISLSKKLISTIEKFKDNMFLQIDVHSLNSHYYDWFTGSKGCLERVKRNIDILVSKGANIRVVSIMTPMNYNELEDLIIWSKSHGAISYATSVVTELGRAKNTNKMDETLFFNESEVFNEYINNYERMMIKYPEFIRIVNEDNRNTVYCGALTSQLSIRSDGQLKLCTMDTGNYFKLGLGNIFVDDLQEIYKRNSSFILGLSSMQLPDAETICNSCENAMFCNRCLLRGLISSKTMGEKCVWFTKEIPALLRERLSEV